DFLVLPDETDAAQHVVDVNPTELLQAASSTERVVRACGDAGGGGRPRTVDLRPAQAETSESDERRERTSIAEHDRHPQRNPARCRKLGREELLLPAGGDRDREPRADLSARLRHRTVLGMTVDRGRGGVQPEGWWRVTLRNRRREFAGRVDAGAQDLAPVRLAIATVHALAREIDEEVGSLEDARDPCRVAPTGIRTVSTDETDACAVLAERRSEVAADEARGSRDYDVVGHPGVPPWVSAVIAYSK